MRFLQDPSVQRAVAGSGGAVHANLEDYNPFDPSQTRTTPGQVMCL